MPGGRDRRIQSRQQVSSGFSEKPCFIGRRAIEEDAYCQHKSFINTHTHTQSQRERERERERTETKTKTKTKTNNKTTQIPVGFCFCLFALLELDLWTRLVSNSQRSACLCLPSAGIRSMNGQFCPTLIYVSANEFI